MTFRAFVVDDANDTFSAGVRQVDEDALPQGELLVRVEWSSVNYKDGLASVPGNRVVRSYPMVPGVDLAGVVVRSEVPAFKPGDAVVATGWDLGTAHWGGFSELARIPVAWAMHLPAGLTSREAMAIGTAGLTAALSLEALETHGLTPASGPVIVTGSTGGVGSTAVSMLAALGYEVAASTGKPQEAAFLRDLGATLILSREEVSAPQERPMESARWAGAIDPVGGATTAYLARTMRYGASIALSGNTGGVEFHTTVLPFILRGVNLLGIESVQTPMDIRERVWARLATDLKPRGLTESIAVEAELEDLPSVLSRIVEGKIRGRTVVRLS